MMRRCSAGSRGQLESSGSQPPPIAESPMTPALILFHPRRSCSAAAPRSTFHRGQQALVSRVAGADYLNTSDRYELRVTRT